jgi:Tfp pilus assembly protein PilN
VSARGGINLAARPFVNERPVQRVTLLLWALGALLALTAGWSYWAYFAGRADQRRELARLEQAMDAERGQIAELQRRLAGFELESQNQRVRFLNQRIAERTFSWSLLFDRLAEILPGDVRLLNLAPEVGFGEDQRFDEKSLAATPGERVPLRIRATARREEAILELLDALFASPLFERPNLAEESREQAGGDTRFSLSVVYLPAAAEASEGGAAAGDPDGPDGPDQPDLPAAGSPVPTAAVDPAVEPGAAAAGREDPT